MMIPDHLYKYEKINVQTLRNLKNSQIFFNTPSSFNDPFDCAVLEASVVFKDDDYINYFKHYIDKKGIHFNSDIKDISDIPEKYINLVDHETKKTLKKKQHDWLHERGCTCFSECKNNILMWSHYADSHKGFCLEFNTSFAPFQKAMKVYYSRKFPSISPMSLIDQNQQTGDGLLSPLLRKYKRWTYEKEWRLFHHKPHIHYGYEADALNAVYFGSSADDSDIRIVFSLLKDKNKKARFYKARKDVSEYLLHFDEIYCSH